MNHTLPDLFDLEKVDDLFFNVLAKRHLLPPRFPKIDAAGQYPRFQVHMTAKLNIIQHRHVSEKLYVLKGAGDAQLRDFMCS